MLAAKQESGVRVVVHSVVTENDSLLVLEQSDIFFFRIWFLFDKLDKRRLCTSDTNK